MSKNTHKALKIKEILRGPFEFKRPINNGHFLEKYYLCLSFNLGNSIVLKK